MSASAHGEDDGRLAEPHLREALKLLTALESHVRTAVSPDYFALMGIPLRSGRVFTEADDWNSPRVVVVSEALARRYWGEDDALGRKLTHGSAPGADAPDDSTWYTVVGAVASPSWRPWGRRGGPCGSTRSERWTPNKS